MSVHPIDEDQIFQMMRVYEGYQELFAETFLSKKMQQQKEDIETTIQDELREAIIYIGDKEAFIKEITSKSLEIFNNVRASMIVRAEKITVLESKIQQLQKQNHNLQGEVKLLDEQSQNNERTHQRLQKRIIQLQKMMQQHYKDLKNQQQLIRESQTAYSQLSETSIIKQKNLVVENEKINSLITEYKSEIDIQKDQISTYQEQIKELSNKVLGSQGKINNLNTQKEQLQTKIIELENYIYSLQEQMKQQKRYYTIRKYSDKQQQYVPAPRDQSVILQIKNLNDEFKQTQIIFEQEDVFTYTNNMIEKANSMNFLGDIKPNPEQKQKQKVQIKKQVIQQKKKQTPPNRMMIDPYYAHFILTSQSVKIRLEHDEFLGIDFQKYYKEVMESGIQMHNWPQWIQKKLIELTPGH